MIAALPRSMSRFYERRQADPKTESGLNRLRSAAYMGPAKPRLQTHKTDSPPAHFLIQSPRKETCMDRDHFWLNDRQFALHVPHSADGKPRVDDRRVISGIVYVLLTDRRLLSSIGFLLTGGMRPIAIWVASI